MEQLAGGKELVVEWKISGFPGWEVAFHGDYRLMVKADHWELALFSSWQRSGDATDLEDAKQKAEAALRERLGK